MPMTDYPYARTAPLWRLRSSPDGRALRTGRRDRALAQMEAYDLDVLVLGQTGQCPLRRQGRHNSGSPGRGPSGRSASWSASTGEIHLNSSWDEGMPEEIPHDHLYGLAWNPMTLIEVLRNIDGAATASRVGTDALSPTFAQLLPMAFPNAELVDGELAMRTARRIKTPKKSWPSARGGCGWPKLAWPPPFRIVARHHRAVVDRRDAGGRGRWRGEHVGHSGRRMGDVARAPVAAGPRDGRSPNGDLVAFAAGVLADGYVGEVGRTVAGGRRRRRRDRALRSFECAVGQANCGMQARGAGERTAGRHTKPQANRCPRCRSRTASASGSTRRWCRRTCRDHRSRETWTRDGAGRDRIRMGAGRRCGLHREAVLITDDGAEVLTSTPRSVVSVAPE